ncbi:hypothetical protein BFDFBN_BFDFBN_17285, partial [Dysosmobacter welbionis]
SRKVSRKIRTVRLSASFLRSTVAHPSHGFNIVPPQLVAEVFDVAVHHPFIPEEVVAPQPGEQHL